MAKLESRSLFEYPDLEAIYQALTGGRGSVLLPNGEKLPIHDVKSLIEDEEDPSFLRSFSYVDWKGCRYVRWIFPGKISVIRLSDRSSRGHIKGHLIRVWT
jgi:hypothetical protein